MGKVSIAFRGWRFDEGEVFDENGDFRALDEMSRDTSRRLVRLSVLKDLPCDACWLVHGDENIRRCREPTVVYGEPMSEVLLCDEHERDFYYWYQEAGGSEYAGSEAFEDAFHEWFADGNRAPDEYESPEHVETEPDRVPEPDVPDPSAFNRELPEDEQVNIDLRDVDLGEDYPKR